MTEEDMGVPGISSAVGGVRTCATCAHFRPDDVAWPSYGSCARWRQGYGTHLSEVATNEVLVENDEGWAMVMGPDFGCVLHAANADTTDRSGKPRDDQ